MVLGALTMSHRNRDLVMPIVVVDRRTGKSAAERPRAAMGDADAPRALTTDVLAKLLVQSPASGLPARGASAAADCTEWCPKVP
jgi:hypothetical protein